MSPSIPVFKDAPRAPDRFLARIHAALGEPDAAKRIEALRAALAAWAGTDPQAAVEWARGQNQSWRTDAIDSALAIGAQRPDITLPLALDLFAGESVLFEAIGGNFVSALLANGQFASAAPLLAMAPADVQSDWATLVFRQWGATEPHAALASLAQFPGNLRAASLRALLEGWAGVRPAEVADYAAMLPTGQEHDQALAAVVKNWSLQDPAAFSVWLSRQPPGPALDPAAAALVLRADTLNRTPEIALSWAETITDLPLRQQALVHALRELARKDSAAAQRYVARSPDFNAAQREQINRMFATN